MIRTAAQGWQMVEDVPPALGLNVPCVKMRENGEVGKGGMTMKRGRRKRCRRAVLCSHRRAGQALILASKWIVRALHNGGGTNAEKVRGRGQGKQRKWGRALCPARTRSGVAHTRNAPPHRVGNTMRLLHLPCYYKSPWSSCCKWCCPRRSKSQ